MKISYNWLKEFLPINLEPSIVADLLTFSGLEVESIEHYQSIKGGLKGVVVGEVLTKEKHPDADRLSVTTVNVGGEIPLSIVCGAPNVAAGQKVLVATVGSVLHTFGGEKIEIKKSKIRGAASEGMICAEDEIGLGQSHDGIMILPETFVPGTPASKALKIYEDFVFEIGLTPNRADAASHLGVARDLYALVKTKKLAEADLRMPSVNAFKEGSESVNIEVASAESAPRYAGLLIRNVKVSESPEWLKNKLQAIGVRSINNIVDVTNYVLHELGQPLHAFDFDKIEGGKVVVRNAAEGELFTTLDGVQRKLSANDLVIADASKPLCLAGVFGGANSGVSESTQNVFLESAHFNPVQVRISSKAHGLKTDASFRFERGTDPNIVAEALKRAALLITEVSGGVVASKINDIYPVEIENFNTQISIKNITRLIGKEIPEETIQQILESLQIIVVSKTNDLWTLSIPPFKVDVQRECDIAEEVLRIYGYNNIEIPSKLNASLIVNTGIDITEFKNSLANLLSANAYFEVMNNSLSSSSIHNSEEVVKLLNPLSSELDVLRPTLITGILQTVAYNVNRKNADLKIYEYGKAYSQSGEKYKEIEVLAIAASGNIAGQSWERNVQKTDIYSLKSLVDFLIQKTIPNSKLSISEAENKYLSNSLSYVINNKVIANIGRVGNAYTKIADVSQDVFYAEIYVEELFNLYKKSKVKFSEISKFPEVRRDLSLLIDKSISFNQLKEEAIACDKRLLKEINLFDVYEGDKLPENKKSYALSFTLQDVNATLTDGQIEGVMKKIIKAYESKFGASLRN